MNIDEVLLFATRVLLRTCSPAKAHAVLSRLGVFLAAVVPARSTAGELRSAAERLGARGSCLSRALALSARAPESDVVIGVEPLRRVGLNAHAWLEFRGERFEPLDPARQWVEIGRLRGRRTPGMLSVNLAPLNGGGPGRTEPDSGS